MIIAFLLITGVALLYLSVIRMDIAESYAMSVATLIVMVYVSGLWKENLLLGRRAYAILAGVGILATVIMSILKKLPQGKIAAIYIILLFALLAFSSLMCHGDFIRHIDEFHMWAAAPKYMLEHNKLPIYQDFIGGRGHKIGTCIFNYFFQSYTGYSEGMMYASTMFLAWIALLLPLGNENNQNWFRNITYVLILHFSFAVLYIHGTASAYVDIATSSWVAGLTGWCIYRNKDRKIRSGILIITMIYVAYMFKGWAGWLFGGFLMAFLFIKVWMEEEESVGLIIKTMRYCALGTFLASVIMIIVLKNVDLQTILPESASTRLISAEYSLIKAEKTIQSIVINVCGKALNFRASQMKVTFLESFCISMGVIVLFGLVNDCLRKSFIYCYYAAIVSLIYLDFLVLGHIFGMSYVFATTFWAGHRYMAIMAIYLLIVAVNLLVFDGGKIKKQNRYSQYVALGILLFFVYGVRPNYLSYYTPLDKEKNSHYADIEKQKVEAAIIQETIGKDKKVYFLNQKGIITDEFETNPALYFLDDQISDYREVPWQFSEDGASIKVANYGGYTINGFPQILRDGDYSYVWIYQTDDFLNNNLPHVIKIFGEKDNGLIDKQGQSMIDGQLYKIVYKKSKEIMELKLIKNLKPYDNRHWHNGYE